jgi:prepilin-type N-terminal cleavage/methylation domain-containing protein
VKRSTGGFTLVEVLVAVTILGVGIIGLVGSSAMVTRMIGRGQKATRAAQVASQRLEKLRLLAYSTNPKCTAGGFANGTAAAGTMGVSGVSEAWTIVATGKQRTITEIVSYKTARGQTHSETLKTAIEC